MCGLVFTFLNTCSSTVSVLGLVRLIVGEELVSKVSKVELMKNEECAAILTEAKDYHIVIPTQPVMQTCRTQVSTCLFHKQTRCMTNNNGLSWESSNPMQ